MKPLLTGALLLLLSFPLFAGTNGTNAGGYRPFTLPADPSALQLTKLFTETTEGLHDPFMVLRKVSKMGDTVVTALNAFLFNTPVLKAAVVGPDGKTVDSVLAPSPNKVYGIMALDLIGTPAAYQVIATAAQSDSNPEVRGMALRALATSYYYRAREDSLTPDKAVVGLLLDNLDDTTYVRSCGWRISAIARDGLKKWTGVDYGTVPLDSMRIKVEKRLGMTLTQYREKRWQKNSANVKWDVKKGRFVAKQ